MDEFQSKNNDTQENPNLGKEQEDKDIVATNFNGQPPNIAPHSTRDEETATELTADDIDAPTKAEDDNDVRSAVGWIGLALSVLSFFIMPIILGAAGIIMGFIAKNRGANTLGYTAIGAGALSIVIRLFVIPFV